MTTSDNTADDELITLIARCAIRDQTALKQLFERAAPYLNAVTLRILKSKEISNEVLQETFFQIWNNAASYRPQLAKPLTWMASIARYRALDRLDQEKHLDKRFVELPDDMEDTPGGDEPERLFGTAQLKFHLHQCLHTLGNNIKQSIELAYLYGYTREEIAEQFATNTNTVKSWLHRGAERLKLCLEAKQHIHL